MRVRARHVTIAAGEQPGVEPASSHTPAATGRLGRFRDPILPVAPATGLARSSAAVHVFDRAKQMPKKRETHTSVCEMANFLSCTTTLVL